MPTITMGAVPWWHAARQPKAFAVVHGQDTLTWEQLARNASRQARALLAFGVQPNDRVTIALPNGNAFYEAVYAAWMVGATPNPVSPRLPAQELRGILELAKPTTIIVTDAHTIPEWPVLTQERLAVEYGDEPLAEIAADHWKLIASGGSTGRPKLILDRTPAKIDPSAYTLFDPVDHGGRLGRTDGVMLMPGPLYHNGPFAISLLNMFAGSTIVGMTRFDPEEVLRQVERHRVELLYLVPTMMHRIWNLAPSIRAAYDLSSLRGVLHLGAPCAPWLKLAWMEWLGRERIWETYGSTESLANTLISGEEWISHRGSVGRCYRGHCKVLDADGTPLSPGEIGELWFMPVGGPGSTYEYIGAERCMRDGWESIGDMGSMDADGYLYISDRRTDLILRGGVNIYPAEIEAAIESHPAVVCAAVIGLPDDDLGARLHAVVQQRLDAPNLVTESELLFFLEDRLARHKIPASIEFVSHNLRDDAGKIRRSALLAERPHTLGAAADRVTRPLRRRH
jgi:bile acid-coenzyme A ligase